MKIKRWRLEIELENGDLEWVTDFPNGMAQDIDDWLTIIENNLNSGA